MTEEFNTTKYNVPAANECALIREMLYRTADLLHHENGRTPLRAFGLEKSTHMKAAAKVLRSIALSLVEREEGLRGGK